MLTLVGLLTIGLLGGTVFVETIFALPGLGAMRFSGAQQQDVPVVQGIDGVLHVDHHRDQPSHRPRLHLA